MTHLGVMFQQAAAVWPRPKTIDEDDGMCDDFLGQAEEDSCRLRQLGGAESHGRLEVGGDAVEVRCARFQLGGCCQRVGQMGRLRDGRHGG